ncbi:immunoglobulin domain-containing family protein [Thermomonospora echinospora]|uniref:hypothetical protein n=1 Tax=Thermomonospora echinospora TaxID=1992 RepID=UPI000CDE7A51|nr:hypothetical protein [Thermomonospora echinospora]
MLAGSMVVGPIAGHAAADNTGIAVWATLDRMDPAHPVDLDLWASSPKGITAVRVKLRHLKRDAEPYAVVEDFTLYQGDDKDGRWRAAYPVDIEARPGLTFVEAEADVADGTVKNGWFAPFTACYKSTLTEMSVQPDVIDIDHRDIVVRGRATFQRSRDHAPEPVVNAQAYLQGQRNSAAHTDADGRFEYQAVAGSDSVISYVDPSPHAPSCTASTWVNLQTVPQETQISARLVEPTGRINAGDPIVIEGRVLRKAASGMVPAQVTVQAMLDTGPGENDHTYLPDGVSTAADGTFRLQTPAPRSGRLSVRNGSTPFLTENSVPVGEIDVVHPTKFIQFFASKAGSGVVTVQGILSRQEATGLFTLPYRRVIIESSTNGKTWSQQGDALTDGNGQFRTHVATRIEGHWRARYVGEGAEVSSHSPARYVQLYTPTRFAGFNVTPEPVGKGSTVTARGRLLQTSADDGTEFGLANTPVALEFSTDGVRWRTVRQGRTGSDAWATLKAPATTDGQWRMRYAGDAELRAVHSTADHVDVRLRTSVTAFNAAPEPVRKGAMLTVSGRLNRYDTSWGPITGRRKLTVYFRAKGATKWTKVGTVTTDTKGRFSKRYKATKHGSWRVSFAGDLNHLPTVSAADHVNVR